MVVYITGVLSSRSQSRVSICTYKENKPQNFVSNAQNFKYSHQNTISSGKEEHSLKVFFLTVLHQLETKFTITSFVLALNILSPLYHLSLKV